MTRRRHHDIETEDLARTMGWIDADFYTAAYGYQPPWEAVGQTKETFPTATDEMIEAEVQRYFSPENWYREFDDKDSPLLGQEAAVVRWIIAIRNQMQEGAQ